MKIFIMIWFGQFVSRVGTAMTRFALLIWAYQQTNSATTVALLGFFAFLPPILIGPIAGVWVDRLNRRTIMLLADLGAGMMTVGMLLLFATGQLQIWHLYLAEALAGAFESFQIPAYTAATTTLLSKEQYARANGLRSMADWGARVLGPVLAGLCLTWLGIVGVMLIDVATFVVAMITLALIYIPHHTKEKSEPATEMKGQFRKEMRVGFSYIWQRPGLLGLMLIQTGIYFIDGLTYLSILPAMILARSGGNEMALASVQGALGAAGVAGGLIMTVWGGPKRKIHGVLIGAALSFFLGEMLLAVGHTIPVWIFAAGVTAIFIPCIVSCDQAIWQAKVAPEVQGRVLSVSRMVGQSMGPPGILLGGILADHWLEPAMMPNGALAPLFGGFIGAGPGAGMALMFAATAILGAVMSLSGYLFSAVRNIENDLPDYDAVPATVEQNSTTVVDAGLGDAPNPTFNPTI